MNESYWQKTTYPLNFDSIQTNIETDIVIIGAGMSGVSLAYQLKDLPFHVIVVEKDQIGSHTSGHTTGKLTTLHGRIYQLLNKYYNIHYAYLYFCSQQDALLKIKEIIQKEGIACDYQENDAYLYTDDPQYVSVIQETENLLKAFRVETLKDDNHLASVGLKEQAVFHPLKYLYQLVNICQQSGVTFYEHSQVKKIKRKHGYFELLINQNVIKAQYVVHATRYPFIKKGMYFTKLFQTKENVDCLEYSGDKSQLCVNQTKSYRPVGKHGLYINIDSKEWYAMDSVPLRGVPYIGETKSNSHEYIIYGFQKWGMTLSYVAAQLIRDLITNQENSYRHLYCNQYFSLGFAGEYQKQLIKAYYLGFIYPRFHYLHLHQIKDETGAIVKINGKLRAVYKDGEGRCHEFSPYCPHLKCILQFDDRNKIWICPCHQSTFNAYGELIDGPSLRRMKEKGKRRK